jgi:AcrR family transcriptional regulator
MQKDISTEIKIKEAATRVFVAKGFNGCTSREIAKESGMNVALVNYYFKSKGQLFEIVISTIIENFSKSMFEIFKSDLSLESKIRIFIEKEYEFLDKHPEIPNFIISELNKKEELILENFHFSEAMLDAKVPSQVIDAQNNGSMRRINLVNIIMILISNTHFPFMGKALIKSIHTIEGNEYKNHLLIHKQHVTEMIMSYLFPLNNKG